MSQEQEQPKRPENTGDAARRPKQVRKQQRTRDVTVATPEESQLQNYELTRHKGRRRKRGAAAVGELNLTSMIDVIFLLLIYFVITANFVEDEGVLIAKLPSGTGSTAAEEELPKLPVNIVLTSRSDTDCLIEVDGQVVNGFLALGQYMMELQDNRIKGREGVYQPDNPIIIRPGSQVRWQHVVNAFNACVRAEYSNVSFAQATAEG